MIFIRRVFIALILVLVFTSVGFAGDIRQDLSVKDKSGDTVVDIQMQKIGGGYSVPIQGSGAVSKDTVKDMIDMYEMTGQVPSFAVKDVTVDNFNQKMAEVLENGKYVDKYGGTGTFPEGSTIEGELFEGVAWTKTTVLDVYAAKYVEPVVESVDIETMTYEEAKKAVNAIRDAYQNLVFDMEMTPDSLTEEDLSYKSYYEGELEKINNMLEANAYEEDFINFAEALEDHKIVQEKYKSQYPELTSIETTTTTTTTGFWEGLWETTLEKAVASLDTVTDFIASPAMADDQIDPDTGLPVGMTIEEYDKIQDEMKSSGDNADEGDYSNYDNDAQTDYSGTYSGVSSDGTYEYGVEDDEWDAEFDAKQDIEREIAEVEGKIADAKTELENPMNDETQITETQDRIDELESELAELNLDKAVMEAELETKDIESTDTYDTSYESGRISDEMDELESTNIEDMGAIDNSLDDLNYEDGLVEGIENWESGFGDDYEVDSVNDLDTDVKTAQQANEELDQKITETLDNLIETENAILEEQDKKIAELEEQLEKAERGVIEGTDYNQDGKVGLESYDTNDYLGLAEAIEEPSVTDKIVGGIKSAVSAVTDFFGFTSSSSTSTPSVTETSPLNLPEGTSYTYESEGIGRTDPNTGIEVGGFTTNADGKIGYQNSVATEDSITQNVGIGIHNTVGQVFAGVANTVNTAYNGVVDVGSTIKDAFTGDATFGDVAKSVGSLAYDTAKAAVEAVSDTVSTAWEGVKDIAKSVAKTFGWEEEEEPDKKSTDPAAGTTPEAEEEESGFFGGIADAIGGFFEGMFGGEEEEEPGATTEAGEEEEKSSLEGGVNTNTGTGASNVEGGAVRDDKPTSGPGSVGSTSDPTNDLREKTNPDQTTVEAGSVSSTVDSTGMSASTSITTTTDRGSDGNSEDSSEDSGGFGCFTYNQLVLTPNGEVKIGNIRVGDEVISYDYSNNEYVVSIIDEIAIHDNINLETHDFESYNLINLEYINNDGEIREIETTENHYFFSPEDNRYVIIKDFDIGDKLLSRDSEVVEIISKEVLISEQEGAVVVYNLHMSNEPHNYFVNGVLVHNIK